jgi:hypothetical protein
MTTGMGMGIHGPDRSMGILGRGQEVPRSIGETSYKRTKDVCVQLKDAFVRIGGGALKVEIGAKSDEIQTAHEVTFVCSEARAELARVVTETIWKEVDVPEWDRFAVICQRTRPGGSCWIVR